MLSVFIQQLPCIAIEQAITSQLLATRDNYYLSVSRQPTITKSSLAQNHLYNLRQGLRFSLHKG